MSKLEQRIDMERPVLTLGFELESYLMEMDKKERKAFYKGFSKCLKLQTIAITKQVGKYVLPDQVEDLHECILQEMTIESERDFERVQELIEVQE